MSEKPPSHDYYDYSVLVSDAFKQVVRQVLGSCAKTGLKGTHHFYITFETTHPKVEIPKALKLAYPAEMTIVIQHEFYDLKVNEDDFSVTLLFNKQPSNLVIPYDSMRAFFDPSVDVKLFFKTQDDGDSHVAKTPQQQTLMLEEELVDIELNSDYDTDVIGFGTNGADKTHHAESQDNKDDKDKTAPVEVIMLDKFRKNNEPKNE
ncbi:MAG: hypothetical protein K0U45_06650 [Alphaproteobacteria bacterium]|nr:hypothetical protein [Alphaproteobacteria bacterium]